MKRVIIGLFAAASIAALGACADDEYRTHGGGMYVGVGVGDDAYYDAYYDDYYGPIYDGYWDNDVFVFRDGKDHAWRRDTDRHFRREQSDGYHSVHGQFHGPRPHDDDHH